ncbi:MAG: nucleotidyltransferase [Clostridia bacterium]|nr:nucleotidyltransferase [Clostridia bacterium]
MSKILGIIAEYNPFHYGHLYHIQQSKKLINPDYTVCVISGNFVQRGEPSLIDKWSKTQIALKYGFDMVIELPTVYSISSAENFAEGAIKILDVFDDVTLSFGSEVGDLSILNEFVDILWNEPKEYLTILRHELAKGISYPKARDNALMLYLNNVRKYANVLSNPNNILAIEYLKAIKKLKSKIKPITIKRIGTEYNSLILNGNFASATAIRNLINNNKDIKSLLPKTSFKIVSQNTKYGKIIKNLYAFEKEIIYTLRKMSIEEIHNLQDVSEGLENLIKQAANSCNNLEDLIDIVKTKRYTRSRIQRILLYALLNITKKDIQISYKTKPYIRVLGITSRGKSLLAEINNSKCSVITSLKKFIIINDNKVLKNMLEKDILATNIYTLGYEYDSKANLDYTQKLIIE